MKKNGPFDWVESISSTKEDLVEAGRDIKEYVPFLTNRALSLFPDSILYVNEMNHLHGLDRRMQYDYLRHALRKKTRRSGKWPKPEDLEAQQAVSWKYDLSPRKAREALTILPVSHVTDIIKEMKKHAEHG